MESVEAGNMFVSLTPYLELITHVAEELIIRVDGGCPLHLHKSVREPGVKLMCEVDNLGGAHGASVRVSVDPGLGNRGV